MTLKDILISGKITISGGGGGGGITWDEIAMHTFAGDVVLSDANAVMYSAFRGSQITSISAPNVTKLYNECFWDCFELRAIDMPLASSDSSNASSLFRGCISIESVFLPALTTLWNYCFKDCYALKTLVLPALTNSRQNNFDGCSALKTVDFAKIPNLTANFFNQSPLLDTVILRKSSVVSLDNINAFTGAFASGGAGGTLYVPSSLISSYQTANNWSTILGYANNQIKAIEGSIYEHAYADGTPIA